MIEPAPVGAEYALQCRNRLRRFTLFHNPDVSKPPKEETL